VTPLASKGPVGTRRSLLGRVGFLVRPRLGGERVQVWVLAPR
jgi:hypothetical protein